MLEGDRCAVLVKRYYAGKGVVEEVCGARMIEGKSYCALAHAAADQVEPVYVGVPPPGSFTFDVDWIEVTSPG